MKPKFVLIATLVLSGVFWGGNILADCILDPAGYWTMESQPYSYEGVELDSPDGICSGSACPTADADGVVGSAQRFDGIDDAVTIEDNGEAIFDPGVTDSFSISVWFRRTVGAVWEDNEVLVGRYDYGQSHFWLGLAQNTGRGVFRIWDNTMFARADRYDIGIVTGTTNLADGQWHHLVAVRDGQTNQNILYVDGASQGAVTITYTGSLTGDTPMLIGAMNGQYFFDGGMDEIAFFRSALSPTIVEEMYSTGSSGQNICTGNSSGAAPEITSTPPSSAVVGKEYRYEPTAVDPQGGALTWSIAPAVDGMTIDAATGVITWTPTAATTTPMLTLDVVDDTDLHAQQTFAITVTNGDGGGSGDSGGSGSSGCFVSTAAPGGNIALKTIVGALAILALILPTRLIRRKQG